MTGGGNAPLAPHWEGQREQMCYFQVNKNLKCSHFLFKKERKLWILEYWNTLVCADMASGDALSKCLPPPLALAPASMHASNVL